MFRESLYVSNTPLNNFGGSCAQCLCERSWSYVDLRSQSTIPGKVKAGEGEDEPAPLIPF